MADKKISLGKADVQAVRTKSSRTGNDYNYLILKLDNGYYLRASFNDFNFNQKLIEEFEKIQ